MKTKIIGVFFIYFEKIMCAVTYIDEKAVILNSENILQNYFHLDTIYIYVSRFYFSS